MLIVIHGDDITSSYNKLSELLAPASEVERRDLKKDSVDHARGAFENVSLFMEEKTIVLQHLFLLKKKEFDQLVEVIHFHYKNPSYTIVIYEEKVITPTQLSKLPTSTIFSYSLPKHFYNFLDSLYPGNRKGTINHLAHLTSSMSGELLFYSTLKRVRLLLLLMKDKRGVSEELKSLSPWLRSRYLKQAGYWREHELETFYNELFELEMALKTSSLVLPIAQHIDILLIKALN